MVRLLDDDPPAGFGALVPLVAQILHVDEDRTGGRPSWRGGLSGRRLDPLEGHRGLSGLPGLLARLARGRLALTLLYRRRLTRLRGLPGLLALLTCRGRLALTLLHGRRLTWLRGLPGLLALLTCRWLLALALLNRRRLTR